MRRILLALVGLAGLAAAILILLMVFSNTVLNAAVKFTVLGEIPGTHTQLNFTSSIISGASILAVCIAGTIFYRRMYGSSYGMVFESASTTDTSGESAEPFDGEDIIMIARELSDDSIGGHHSLPVQLQLF